jgi:ribosome recycling factor
MDLNDVRDKMAKALQVLAEDLSTLRTGQASPALIEKIIVEAYEGKFPLVELATITTSGPNQLLVAPFDQTIIGNIHRSLSMDRNLGLSAIVDANVIRVQIPPLTQERRQEFTKLLHQKLEAGRVMIRQARHEKMADINQAFEAKQMSEDEKFRLQQELQKITDEFNEKIDEMGQRKERELLAI